MTGPTRPPTPATCNFTDADHTVAGDLAHLRDRRRLLPLPAGAPRRQRAERRSSPATINVAGRHHRRRRRRRHQPSISVSGPSSGLDQPGLHLRRLGAPIARRPAPAGAGASAAGRSPGASTGSSISVSWATAGTKSVRVTNSGCGSATGSRRQHHRSARAAAAVGGTLQAAFSFSPTSPKPGDTVSFDGSASTGSPTAYQLELRRRRGRRRARPPRMPIRCAGSYVVAAGRVEALAPAARSRPASRESTDRPRRWWSRGRRRRRRSRRTSPATATCANVGGFDQCQAQTSQAVTLTAAATDATELQLGLRRRHDRQRRLGEPQPGPQAGSSVVTLTVTKGAATRFQEPGPSSSPARAAAAAGGQVGGAPLDRPDPRRPGAVERPLRPQPEHEPDDRHARVPQAGSAGVNPPQVSKTIAPGATLYVADVLRELFNRQNMAGFVSLTVTQGDTAPVITSYNTTVQADGKQFGQTIGGVSMSPPARRGRADSAATRAGPAPGRPDQQLRPSRLLRRQQPERERRRPITCGSSTSPAS